MDTDLGKGRQQHVFRVPLAQDQLGQQGEVGAGAVLGRHRDGTEPGSLPRAAVGSRLRPPPARTLSLQLVI